MYKYCSSECNEQILIVAGRPRDRKARELSAVSVYVVRSTHFFFLILAVDGVLNFRF